MERAINTRIRAPVPPRHKKAKPVTESKHYNQPEKHEEDDILSTVKNGDPLVERRKYRSKSADKKEEKEPEDSNV